MGESTQAKDCELPDCPGNIIAKHYCFTFSFLEIVTEWQDWGEWSPCTATCGPGFEFRARACLQALPGGDETCPGDSTDTRNCNLEVCAGTTIHKEGKELILLLQGIESVWQDWSEWSQCSTTCGTGSKIRARGCNGMGTCVGESVEVEDCITSDCPGERKLRK